MSVECAPHADNDGGKIDLFYSEKGDTLERKTLSLLSSKSNHFIISDCEGMGRLNDVEMKTEGEGKS